MVRDSASITLVEHGSIDYDQLPQWILLDSGAVRVGVVSGEAAYQWGDIRAADRLSDGTLIALDRDAREIRAFDTDGTHLWTAGREGQGPGEFRFPWSMWVTVSDSIVVSDPGNARLAILSRTGEVVREVSLLRTDGAAVGHGPMGEAGVLLEVRSAEPTQLEGYKALIQTSTFRQAALSGELILELGTHELDRQYDVVGGAEGSFGLKLFASQSVFAGSPAGMWHSDSKSYEVRLITEDGRPIRVVRWEGPSRRISTADVDRLREVTLARFADQPDVLREVRAYFSDQPVAEAMASFESLTIDRAGRLWVQDYQRPDLPDENVGWLILSENGEEVLGRLLHTPTFELMSVGDGWVVGKSVDELGVEYLELRRLGRP